MLDDVGWRWMTLDGVGGRQHHGARFCFKADRDKVQRGLLDWHGHLGWRWVTLGGVGWSWVALGDIG